MTFHGLAVREIGSQGTQWINYSDIVGDAPLDENVAVSTNQTFVFTGNREQSCLQ